MKRLGFVSLFAVLVCAEPRRVVLLEEFVRIEALGARTYELPLPQQKAALELRWSVKSPGEGVRLVVFDRQGSRTSFDSGYAREGSHRVKLDQARVYQLTVDNRQQTAGQALIDLRLELAFGEPPAPVSVERGPTPARRFGAIAASLALFAMLVTYAGVRLAPAVWARWGPRRRHVPDHDDLRAV
jgi:hypothetical protein